VFNILGVQPVEIRCCYKCVDRIANAVRTLPGVEGVSFDEYDEVLKIIGSADDDVIHQAVKYARKGNPGHYHFWPRKIHLLSPSRTSTCYPSTRYVPSWNQPVQYRVSHYGSSYTPSYLYEDELASGRYADTYGPASFGYAAQSPYSTYYAPYF
jgi:copper chaperone CopZ